MWLIIEVDVEHDYPNAYGPFETEQAANAALPDQDKTSTTHWHVTELKNAEKITATKPDNEPAAPKSAIEDLTDIYGAIDNIPAPNPNVYAHANQQLHTLRATITQGEHPDPEEQAARFAQIIYLSELARIHRPRAGF